MLPSPQTPLSLSAIAQTNLAFYKQLHAAGYDQAALLRVRDSYEFATTLFAAQFRGTGKPFLAHLVGTASVLAALDAAPSIVTAGLLHASYQQGDWGYTPQSKRRQKMRAAIGAEAEALVWRYNELGWAMPTIHRLHAGFEILSQDDRTIMLMRLANEVEDYLDLGRCHVDLLQGEYRDVRVVFIAMAEALDQPQLAAALADVFHETDNAAWAQALSLGHSHTYKIHSPLLMKMLRAFRALIKALHR